MKLKNRALKAIKLYFVLFTLISILLMILGLTLDADRQLSYSVFVSPLIYAAVGVLPVLIFDQEKELSMKGLVLRQVVVLGLLEAVYLYLAFSVETIPTEKHGVVIAIALGIAVVYALTYVVEYILESLESKEMNAYLSRYQSRQS